MLDFCGACRVRVLRGPGGRAAKLKRLAVGSVPGMGVSIIVLIQGRPGDKAFADALAAWNSGDAKRSPHVEILDRPEPAGAAVIEPRRLPAARPVPITEPGCGGRDRPVGAAGEGPATILAVFIGMEGTQTSAAAPPPARQ